MANKPKARIKFIDTDVMIHIEWGTNESRITVEFVANEYPQQGGWNPIVSWGTGVTDFDTLKDFQRALAHAERVILCVSEKLANNLELKEIPKILEALNEEA